MRFLVPVGGITEGVYGIFSSYKHMGIPIGIRNGLPWAGDNCAFSGFDATRFSKWLSQMIAYRSTCLFVAVPDVVGDASATLAQYEVWSRIMAEWPMAYVAQDGSEMLDIPESATSLFIGGTTAWKVSDGAAETIQRGRSLGKHIHIGRVNWWKRYAHFRSMQGSDDFTCDGTRTRYGGVESTLKAWRQYEEREVPIKRG